MLLESPPAVPAPQCEKQCIPFDRPGADASGAPPVLDWPGSSFKGREGRPASRVSGDGGLTGHYGRLRRAAVTALVTAPP